MLIQALASYADTYLKAQLEDEAFEEKPVPYFVEIDEEGAFLAMVPRFVETTVKAGKKEKVIRRPETRIVPKSPVNRNSGDHPLLGCDALHYVLGPNVGVWSDETAVAKERGHHDAFVTLIRDLASASGDLMLRGCTRFYEREGELEKARAEAARIVDKKFKTGLFALSVRPGAAGPGDGGGILVERDEVRRLWADHYRRKFGKRHEKAGVGTCLLTGRSGQIAVTHDKIKGTSDIGGQPAGVSLMSFDKAAFQSYGWEKNTNSPMSPERATAYVLALNDLLRKGEHRPGRTPGRVVRTRSDLGGVAFLYWTTKPVDEDPFSLFDSPDPTEVARLLASPWSGSEPAEGEEDNAFHLLVVSGNGGRLVVRDWFRDSLARVRSNLRDWFAGLRMADVYRGGGSAPPPGLWEILRLASPPAVEPGDPANAERAMRLVRRALNGVPLPRSLLSALLARLRKADEKGRIDPARMAVLRLCVNDVSRVEGKGEGSMDERLDPGQAHPAYLCGRLLALYEALQFAAQGGELNVNIADRYYGMASTHPNLAFPRIETLSRSHLKKLRRDRPAAARALSARIDDLAARLAGGEARFPGLLNLEDQGRFAIGYHHQKASDAAERKARAEAKANDAAITPDREGEMAD